MPPARDSSGTSTDRPGLARLPVRAVARVGPPQPPGDREPAEDPGKRQPRPEDRHVAGEGQRPHEDEDAEPQGPPGHLPSSPAAAAPGGRAHRNIIERSLARCERMLQTVDVIFVTN